MNYCELRAALPPGTYGTDELARKLGVSRRRAQFICRATTLSEAAKRHSLRVETTGRRLYLIRE